MTMLEPIKPMEPISSTQIPTGDEWIAQIKWDGVRILTYYDGKCVRLFNRKKNERTDHYPELLNISTFCSAKSVILDGEVIALAEDGKPSFHEVMRRDGLRKLDKVKFLRQSVPIFYMIFDVLYLDGVWVTSKPFSERSQLLHSIIQPNETIQVVSSFENGEELFQLMENQGMEGVVMKRQSSTYQIGQKQEWMKVKNYQDLIAVVGGYTLRQGTANSLILGLFDDEGHLYYIGHAGTGKFTHQEWRTLTDQLKQIETTDRPFKTAVEREDEAHWVHPKLTVKITYAEWTAGRALRQPSIQGLTDAEPLSCRFEKDMQR